MNSWDKDGMVTEDGLVVHFRAGAPGVRLHGSKGDLAFNFSQHGSSG